MVDPSAVTTAIPPKSFPVSRDESIELMAIELMAGPAQEPKVTNMVRRRKAGGDTRIAIPAYPMISMRTLSLTVMRSNLLSAKV